MNKSPKAFAFRCGIVSIVGRPNVGKSTLLNALVGEKVAIVSAVAQTTRNPVRGIYNDERGQIIFIDTPGLHANRDRLDRYMNKSALGTTVGADCIVHLVDTSEPVGREEKDIVERLAALRAPIILGLNKVDKSHGRYIPEYIRLWEEGLGQPVQDLTSFVLLALSGTKGIHLKELVDALFNFLPEGEAHYPKDTVCDVPQKMAIADIIREKLFNLLRQELPHALAVIIEEMQTRSNKTVYLRALIFIEKESQKMIVIGKDGQVLKKIGTIARQELEELLENKVFLELHVKNKKNWRDNHALLEDMGYEVS